MSEHPGKPKLSRNQIEMAILEVEIAVDEAKTALKTYRKSRLEQAETLKRIEANEAVKNKAIRDGEVALKDLEAQLSDLDSAAQTKEDK